MFVEVCTPSSSGVSRAPRDGLLCRVAKGKRLGCGLPPPRAQLALHKGTDKSVKGATYVAYFATRVAEGSEILMSAPALE